MSVTCDHSCNDSSTELRQIISVIDKLTRRKDQKREEIGSWSKYNGDVVCRIIKGFLEKHTPRNLQVVGPNVFIEGHPFESDLMIIDSDSEPVQFTNCYRSDIVRFLIEVKSRGHMDKAFPDRLRLRFDDITRRFPNVRCVYLTVRESGTPKRSNSINYLGQIRKTLEPRHRVFRLKDSRTNEEYGEQWGEFIKFLFDPRQGHVT